MKNIINSTYSQIIICIIIAINSITLGLLSSKPFFNNYFLIRVDEICLYLFIVEMLIKILVFRLDFFKSKWDLFDLFVILLSVLPIVFGNITILRIFRLFKIMRIFSNFSKLRFVLNVILHSIPNALCVAFLVIVIYYVYAIIGISLFATTAPIYFGSLGRSIFTLFQIMTGESWSEAIARPIMEEHPFSWIYFVSFIVIVSFVVLNMIIGIIVDSINELKQNDKKE